MILLLHGEDSFHSWRKLQLIKGRFLSTQDANNLHEYSADQLDSLDFFSLLVPSLWSGHQLIVIRDLMGLGSAKAKDNCLAAIEKGVDPGSTLIFWESGSFDRRQKLFKQLNQPKCAEEFKVPHPSQLPAFAESLANEMELKLTKEQARKLADSSDGDCWKIYQEINKLSAAPESLRSDLISPSQETAAFALQDAISSKNPQEAHRVLTQNIVNGDDPQLVMGGIAATLRNLILISSLSGEGKDMRSIAAATSIHPFVLQKLQQLAKSKDTSYWENLYKGLSQTDWQMKTGALSGDGILEPTIVKISA